MEKLFFINKSFPPHLSSFIKHSLWRCYMVILIRIILLMHTCSGIFVQWINNAHISDRWINHYKLGTQREPLCIRVSTLLIFNNNVLVIKALITVCLSLIFYMLSNKTKCITVNDL